MNNDRFKFRVFSKFKEHYVPSDNLVITNDGELVEPYYMLDGDIYFSRPTENLIVEQCTGLKDANGKLIYVGDIICGKNPDCLHEIVFDNDNACFRAELLPKPKHWMQNSVYSTPSQHWIDEFSKQIVGNIHETPELLEGKQ